MCDPYYTVMWMKNNMKTTSVIDPAIKENMEDSLMKMSAPPNNRKKKKKSANIYFTKLSHTRANFWAHFHFYYNINGAHPMEFMQIVSISASTKM